MTAASWGLLQCLPWDEAFPSVLPVHQSLLGELGAITQIQGKTLNSYSRQPSWEQAPAQGWVFPAAISHPHSGDGLAVWLHQICLWQGIPCRNNWHHPNLHLFLETGTAPSDSSLQVFPTGSKRSKMLCGYWLRLYVNLLLSLFEDLFGVFYCFFKKKGKRKGQARLLHHVAATTNVTGKPCTQLGAAVPAPAPVRVNQTGINEAAAHSFSPAKTGISTQQPPRLPLLPVKGFTWDDTTFQPYPASPASLQESPVNRWQDSRCPWARHSTGSADQGGFSW